MLGFAVVITHYHIRSLHALEALSKHISICDQPKNKLIREYIEHANECLQMTKIEVGWLNTEAGFEAKLVGLSLLVLNSILDDSLYLSDNSIPKLLDISVFIDLVLDNFAMSLCILNEGG